ncbi:MAG TPA: PecA family PE domain-processing aspartic protease [Mycobacterium sp.]|nr:PecA family PE domain-processing aspartic protease [Mycobacterium sp.]
MTSGPRAHADIDDLIAQPVADVVEHAASAVDPGLLGAVDPGMGVDSLVAPALSAAAAGSLTTASVPLHVEADTEPVVDISVAGGSPVPVVIDTGSTGLVIPWYELGAQNIGWPTGMGVGGYSGGMGYFYVTLPTTVSFGPDTATGADIVTAPTAVDVVLFTWPMSFQAFFAPTDIAGVLGIGSNAGPGPSSVLTALPGDLSRGVLIDQPGGTLQFGPNPLTDGITLGGAPSAFTLVSINGGPTHAVSTYMDSGGVYGTVPQSVFGGNVGDTLPPGTTISVYTMAGQPIYSYAVDATNAPTIASTSTMNSGNVPFAMQPVYIGNGGNGTTIFDSCAGIAGFCTAV